MDSKHRRWESHRPHGVIRAMIQGCNHEDTLQIRSALYTSRYPYNKGQITQEEVKRETQTQEPEIKVKVKTKSKKAKL
jgi:hypothetical protein